jgi:hypothetical protein
MSDATHTAGSPTLVLVQAPLPCIECIGVIERVQAKRVQVTARGNPLRRLSIDSARLEIGGAT